VTENFVDSLNRFIALFAETLGQFRHGRIWLILLVYVALQGVVLLAHKYFFADWCAWFMQPWLALFPEALAEGFTHFPDHYLLLPTFFGWAKLVIGLAFEGLVLGGLALILYDGFIGGDKEERLSLRLLLPSWLTLSLAWFILNGLMLVVGTYLPSWMASTIESSARRQFVFYFGLLPGIYVLILVPLYYVIPAVAIWGETLAQALRRSVFVCLDRPITTLSLAVAMLLGPVIMSVVEMRVDVLVDKFSPETVFWLMAGELIIQSLISVFWMGTAVRVLVEMQD
jgi:hypothetical protein